MSYGQMQATISKRGRSGKIYMALGNICGPRWEYWEDIESKNYYGQSDQGLSDTIYVNLAFPRSALVEFLGLAKFAGMVTALFSCIVPRGSLFP